jgi:hypothetical protein
VEDRRIVKSIALPGTSDAIVLWEGVLNRLNARNDHNLVRLNGRGEIIWTAQLPERTNPDSFVDVRFEGNVLAANTWSCYLVTLDAENGILLTKTFTK